MVRIYLIILVLSVFTACKTTKDVTRQDEDRTLTETSKTITTRLGDTVFYKVPKITFKDTVIKIRNKQGTTQVLRYNAEGRLTETECLSSVIEIIQENNRILIENINNMQKQKVTEIPASTFIYFFIGLALFLVIIFSVMFLLIKKYIKAMLPVV